MLDLAGHTLQAPGGGRQGALHLLKAGVPPVRLHSLTLRNGTLALRPGTWVTFGCRQTALGYWTAPLR